MDETLIFLGEHFWVIIFSMLGLMTFGLLLRLVEIIQYLYNKHKRHG